MLGDLADLPSTATLLSDTVAWRILTRGGHAEGIEVYPLAGGLAQITSGGDHVIAGGVIGTPQLLSASHVDNPALGAYMMDHSMFATRMQLDPEILDDVPSDDASFSVWVPFSQERPWHTRLNRKPYLADLDGVPAHGTGDLIYFSGSSPTPENHLVLHRERRDRFGLPTHDGRFHPRRRRLAHRPQHGL